MTIPFADLFKKLAGRFTGENAEPASVTTHSRAAKKPASERLSKTVLPNATRSFSAPDPFRSASAGPTSPRNTPLQLGAQRVTAAPRRSQSHNLPPALARALEPKIERAITLRIADFIDAVPSGYIKPVEVLDAAARVSLKASEIEKGMPERNPTISLPSLYQQVPEIFLRGVRPDDDTRVSLPYEKVLEQFKTAQVREDQVRDPAVPQLDTPILKATIQDSEKFGIKVEPIETSALPSVPVKPATAESIAEAEPDATVVQEAKKTTPSGHPVISLYSPELKPKSEPPPSPTTPSPPREESVRLPDRSGSIPFELSPNGTGASASERVPASSGPPVPTPLPLTPELAKIAFSPGPSSEKPKPTPTPAAETPTVAESTVPKIDAKIGSSPTVSPEERSITLSLKAALKNLPAFQLSGDIVKVSEDARITLPLELVEKQLATGRVAISPEVFQNALPETYRAMFLADEAKTPVILPLEEVLKNLPATVLKLRDDQEQLHLDADFETPFSKKAKEDAQRFAPPKPIEEDEEASAPVVVVEKKPEESKQADIVDPKKVIEEAITLGGVAACVAMFADGLTLAGHLPEDLEAGGLCAIAPSFLARMDEHMRASKMGELVTMTVHSAEKGMSFFAKGNICMVAVHATDTLTSDTRKKLAELAAKLAAHYAKPE